MQGFEPHNSDSSQIQSSLCLWPSPVPTFRLTWKLPKGSVIRPFAHSLIEQENINNHRQLLLHETCPQEKVSLDHGHVQSA